MNRKQSILTFTIGLLGCIGAVVVVDFISRWIPFLRRFDYVLGFVAFTLPVWLHSDVSKEKLAMLDEIRAVLKHERRKHNAILKAHPLYDANGNPVGTGLTYTLDNYFLGYADEVDGMDYDEDGMWIFRDHKYVKTYDSLR